MSVSEDGGDAPPIRLVVFDHDYTVSRPQDADGDQRYFDTFRDGFRAALEEDPKVFPPRWATCFGQVLGAPGEHGFVYDESVGIVAAATSDVMMLTHAVGRAYVQRFRSDVPHAQYRGMAYDLYKAAYPKLGMKVAPELGRVLNELADLGARTCVITNSATDHVQETLARGLGSGYDTFIASVQGNAAKFNVDPDWTDISALTHVPGLARPYYLRRRKYGEALAQARAQVCPVEGVLVVGDNDELDLALPEELGARVALLETACTPAWSREWAKTLSRGRVRRRHFLQSLYDVVGVVRASHVAAV